MANPVAIYSPEPAALTPRGGSGSAQVIQIDVYRSGAGARVNYVNPTSDEALSNGTPQAQAVRGRFADAARRNSRSGSRSSGSLENDSLFEAGRRRAPASLSFAAQQIAQEGLSPGLYFENYKPAIAAYVAAAAGPTLTPPGQTLELVA
ncbi:MAG TPA: hypothetical protein VMQ11_09980 [Alphaproteobacteria bacterium]|nr:hypothetical protein [Alphaproteobacteria bacterium]